VELAAPPGTEHQAMAGICRSYEKRLQMMKLTITTVTGIGIAAAAGLLSAPLANSAPQALDAASVIKNLETDGYTVNIDRVGSGALDQCRVTGIRNPQTITRTDRSEPGNLRLGDHPTTTIVSKSISVRLDCN
jgi:hypothetical protein